MNQTLPTADLNTAGTTDVIPSVAIDRIIAQRNEGIALFMQAMECLATARRILLDASGDIFLYGFEDCVTDSVRCMDKPEEANKNITHLADRKIWDRLIPLCYCPPPQTVITVITEGVPLIQYIAERFAQSGFFRQRAILLHHPFMQRRQ